MDRLKKIPASILVQLQEILAEMYQEPVIKGPAQLSDQTALLNLAYMAGRRSVVDDISAALRSESEDGDG